MHKWCFADPLLPTAALVGEGGGTLPVGDSLLVCVDVVVDEGKLKKVSVGVVSELPPPLISLLVLVIQRPVGVLLKLVSAGMRVDVVPSAEYFPVRRQLQAVGETQEVVAEIMRVRLAGLVEDGVDLAESGA